MPYQAGPLPQTKRPLNLGFWAGSLTGLFIAAACFHVQAQHLGLWVWKDAQGRMVYSDREPPPTIKPNQIIQQPRVEGSSASPATLRVPEPVSTASLSPREVVKRENCLAAQSSLTELRGRKNWILEDEAGARRPMDDGMRRAETARLRQIMRDNCTYAR